VLAIIVSFGRSETLDTWAQRMIALLERYAGATAFTTTIV
jgi:hypothetical protein